MKKLFLFVTLYLLCTSNSFANDSHFIDFRKVLNSSKAGATAQKQLKLKFESETKKFKKQEQDIINEESEIIAKKKLLSPEDYKKKVEELRKKVSVLQVSKKNSLNSIAKSRQKAKQTLLKVVNPIIKKYMEENNIKLILDKKGVLMGDKNLEITNQIIAILNKELSSLSIN